MRWAAIVVNGKHNNDPIRLKIHRAQLATRQRQLSLYVRGCMILKHVCILVCVHVCTCLSSSRNVSANDTFSVYIYIYIYNKQRVVDFSNFFQLLVTDVTRFEISRFIRGSML
jgi:hypothetical protein